MARYVWIIKAFSPRDGGWVRLFDHYPSEQQSWCLVEAFWDLTVAHGDFVTIDVVRMGSQENKAAEEGDFTELEAQLFE